MEISKRIMRSQMESSRKVNKALKGLKKGKLVEDYYVIYFNIDSPNTFEIIKSDELSKDYYKEQNLVAIGIAFDEEEAYELLRELVQQMVDEDVAITDREYFLQA